MKFHHNIKLTKDLPTYKKGWKFKWDGDTKKYYPFKPSLWKHDDGKESIYLDMEHQGYTIEEVQNSDFFEGYGKEVDYIPAFPSKKEITEYVYFEPTTRLVNNVDFCRAFNEMLNSKGFEDSIYNFYKVSYQQYYQDEA